MSTPSQHFLAPANETAGHVLQSLLNPSNSSFGIRLSPHLNHQILRHSASGHRANWLGMEVYLCPAWSQIDRQACLRQRKLGSKW
jgi:hypothetical protein